MQYRIPHRWNHNPCWEGEIEDQGSDARNLGEAVIAAHKVGASLDGASLVGASLDGASLDGASLDRASLVGASLDGASLDRASLVGARLSYVGKIKTLRVFSGLYRYVCMAILAEDGIPWVRMGCLWKTVEDWDAIGIRASNTGEFPDDGSEQCEDRVLAFDFTRAAALRLAESASRLLS